ncbi:DNA damage-binding protein CMR1-like [Salvia splendens]|nr:DNA damage-binding protein CMR1-like [Salvia splendens]
MGSKGKMTDYERRRLENIQRNNEMLAALKVHSKLNDLSAASAKRTSGEIKSYKPGYVKKPKIETPLVLRRSLRARGVPPDASTANGLDDDGVIDKQINKSRTMNSNSVPNVSPRKQGPIRMHDSFCGEDGLENKLSELVKGCSQKVLLNGNGLISSDSVDVIKGCKSTKIGKKLWSHVEELELKPENIARVVPGRIMSLRFFPTRDMQMVAVGNKFGDIGFWHVNGKDEDGHGIYLYHPHAGPVSGIVIDPFSVSKMYSSCYEGFIRMMDVEKGVFDMIYHSEYCIYSIALSPYDVNSLYFGEGKGGFNKWDVRTGKSSLSCDLHEDRINTIDFNSDTENIMATSSTDGTACIWDLRLMKKDKTTPLKIVKHKRAVHSAYFSPSGKFLATTSYDDKVGLTSGANYESTSMVHHYNQTGRWISTFRGIWGWDDSSIYIGNMKRGVDVISVDEGRLVSTLQSDILSAIPCRFDPHPYNVGVLASATSGGQVYIWTQP